MGKCCAKYTLFAVNLVIWLVGVGLLATAVIAIKPDILSKLDFLGFADVLKQIPQEVFEAFQQMGRTIGTCLAIAGGAIFVLGFLGCCGALCGNATMLTIYALVLIIIIVVELAGAVAVVIMTDKVYGKMASLLLPIVQTDFATNETSTDPKTLGWNAMQNTLKCCGVHDSTDWNESNWKDNQPTVQVVPFTCCVFEGGLPKDALQCQLDAFSYLNKNVPNPDESLHHKGCLTTIKDYFENNKAIAIGAAVGVLAVEVAAVTMACQLRKSNKIDAD